MKKTGNLFSFYIILVPVALVVFIMNAGILQPYVKAVTIGDNVLTATEFNYYYYSEIEDFLNKNSGKLSETGYNTAKKPKYQSYDESRTWEDYFKEQACKRLVRVLALNEMAEEAEYSFSEADYQPVKDKLDEIEHYCAKYGITEDKYFKAYFGAGMTRERYTAQLRLEAQAGCLRGLFGGQAGGYAHPN
ncbi:MAG: hypothetical protein ACOX7I_02645 [Oscillospiraceae bacterium]|jgi:hypothetical protein